MVSAANPAMEVLEKIGSGEKGPYQTATETTLSEIVGIAVQAFLGLIGMIFLVMMLYAGYNWMTARGDEEKVTKAKDTLTRAIIGIIIVVGAYAIWALIFSRLF